MGIYSIKKFGLNPSRGRDKVGVGIRSAYVRVLGIQVDTDGSGESGSRPLLLSWRVHLGSACGPALRVFVELWSRVRELVGQVVPSASPSSLPCRPQLCRLCESAGGRGVPPPGRTPQRL